MKSPPSNDVMNAERDFQRAQLYGFLSTAFLYPQENWTEDLPQLGSLAVDVDGLHELLSVGPFDLAELQGAFRRTFGLANPLCYETEFGLPHEYRQSQELADISGFYRAFGFTTGGQIRERPDHLSVELEFMYALALKSWRAASQDELEGLEICREAQRKFLGDHLARWLGALPEKPAQTPARSPYPELLRFAAAYVGQDAAALGVPKDSSPSWDLTPFDQDFSCEACPVRPE